jgi:hypothetical protein
LSNLGIPTNLLAEIANSPSTANQLVSDRNRIAQDLQSGNLSAAEEDYLTLTRDSIEGGVPARADYLTSAIGSDGAGSSGMVASGSGNEISQDVHTGGSPASSLSSPG